MMTGKTILLADDDAAIRTVLTQALGRAGYSVRATGNAASLWRMVADGEGDLVITDVVLPDESAFEVLPRIKKLRPDLPVIVMSANNTIVTAITARDYPVVQAFTVVVAMIFVLVNLLVDLSYAYLNPRIRVS